MATTRTEADHEQPSGESFSAIGAEHENLPLPRDDEVVLMLRFHIVGGPLEFTGQTYQDHPVALEEISLDRGNRSTG